MSRLNGIGDLIFLSLSCTVANARCNYSYTGDAMQVTIRPIEPVDPFHLTQAFAVWNKPLQQFEQYFLEHTTGFRTTFVAQIDTLLVGYTNILWFSDYIPFAEAGIPLRYVPPKGGRRVGLLVADDFRVTSKGKARVASDRAKKTGRGLTTVVMFILVPQAQLKKRFDIDSVAKKWIDRLPSLVTASWPDEKEEK